MLFLHSLVVFCKVIELTVVCEKVMKDEAINILEFMIRKALDDYNEMFSSSKVTFELKSLLDFTQTTKFPEFEKFSFLVGDNDISKRERSLSDVNTNLIVGFSSLGKVVADRKILSPCKGRYFINIGKARISEEMFATILSAIKTWIEGTFHVTLPNILNRNEKKTPVQLEKVVLERINSCKGNSYIEESTVNTDNENDTANTLEMKNKSSAYNTAKYTNSTDKQLRFDKRDTQKETDSPDNYEIDYRRGKYVLDSLRPEATDRQKQRKEFANEDKIEGYSFKEAPRTPRPLIFDRKKVQQDTANTNKNNISYNSSKDLPHTPRQLIFDRKKNKKADIDNENEQPIDSPSNDNKNTAKLFTKDEDKQQEHSPLSHRNDSYKRSYQQFYDQNKDEQDGTKRTMLRKFRFPTN